MAQDRYQLLKEKLARRETVCMANLMVLTSPLILPAFSSADCVLIDKEHGLFGSEEIVPMTMQCRAMGLPSIIRVEDSVYHLIAKAIDLGADGIMLPRVESVEQVRTAVEAMHFAPIGRTGMGGWGIFRQGEDFNAFQKGRIFLPQIESPKGLAALPEIVEKYGEYIDGFVIGPNDYSIMIGHPLDLDCPEMMEEYRKFFALCQKYGKSCGIFDPDLAHAKRDREMGANIFWLSDDLSCMRSGFEALAGKVRELD